MTMRNKNQVYSPNFSFSIKLQTTRRQFMHVDVFSEKKKREKSDKQSCQQNRKMLGVLIISQECYTSLPQKAKNLKHTHLSILKQTHQFWRQFIS